MPINLGQNENILWEGRGIPSKAGWIASLILFMTMIGAAFYGTTFWGAMIAIFSFLFFLSILAASIINYVSIRSNYYTITNNRIVRRLGTIARRNWELPIEYLASVEIPQASAQKEGRIGNIFFHSFEARNLAFIRVREPARVRQIALDAKSRIPIRTLQPAPQVVEREIITREVLIQCRSCGARYPQGTLKCLTCGAPL